MNAALMDLARGLQPWPVPASRRHWARPWVIREYAPDGKTWHGYNGRTRRFVTRLGAEYVARQLTRVAASEGAAARFQVQWRRKDV